MKRMEIRDFDMYHKEIVMQALERAYQKHKQNPPDAIRFWDDDGEQLWRWEDVEILHFLPDFRAKRSYYWILNLRDKALNGESSAEKLAEDISYYLSNK